MLRYCLPIAGILSLLTACSTVDHSSVSPRQTPPAGQSSTVNADDLMQQLQKRMQAPHKAKPTKPADLQTASTTQHEPIVPPGPLLMDTLDPSHGTKGTTSYLFVTTADSKVDAHKPIVPPALNDAYDKALDLMRNKKYNQALQRMENLAAHNPLYSGPLVNQGLIYLQMGNYTNAEKALEAAVQVNNLNPYAWNALGTALRCQGKFDASRKAYEHALSLDDQYARAHFNLAVLAELYLQDLPLALAHYQRYQELQLTPDPAVAHWIIDLAHRTGTALPKASTTSTSTGKAL
ncbi:MAG: tetratricopeptide repeat protein [Pseudomonadales bacterium]|nr:tetratricopeptide repeat protein [Pseudomonadales bacterium]